MNTYLDIVYVDMCVNAITKVVSDFEVWILYCCGLDEINELDDERSDNKEFIC